MGTGGKAVSEGWRGRWACIGLRGLRDRGAKGKGWSLERAGIVGRKMAFRGGEWCVWKVAREGSDGKWLVVRQLRKCAENGVFGRGAGRDGKKQCRFGGGVLRMGNVSFAWGAAEWGMCHAAQEYFSRRCHRSTQKPCGVLVNNTDCAAGAEDRHRYFAGGKGC